MILYCLVEHTVTHFVPIHHKWHHAHKHGENIGNTEAGGWS